MTSASGTDYPQPGGHGPDEVPDRDTILGRVRRDVGLLRELAQLFAEECPGCLEQIRESLRRGDAAGLYRAAHFLQGSAANVGPSAVCTAARRLETMGRTGDLTTAADAYRDLERALERLQLVLAGFGPAC